MPFRSALPLRISERRRPSRESDAGTSTSALSAASMLSSELQLPSGGGRHVMTLSDTASSLRREQFCSAVGMERRRLRLSLKISRPRHCPMSAGMELS